MGRNIPGSEAAITALVIGWSVYTSTGIKFEDIKSIFNGGLFESSETTEKQAVSARAPDPN